MYIPINTNIDRIDRESRTRDYNRVIFFGPKEPFITD